MKTDINHKVFKKATAAEIATALLKFSSVASDQADVRQAPKEVARILEKKLGPFKMKQDAIPGGGSYSAQLYYYFHFENGQTLHALEQFDLPGWWDYSFVELDSEYFARLFSPEDAANELDNR